MEVVKTKRVFKRISIVFMLLILIIASYFSIKQSSTSNTILGGNSELLRAMTYDQFEDGDEKVEGTDNVEFSAFFLRDIDGDGYAEKIKGTCKEIGKEDTLYMEVIVKTAGYLKDAKIEIDGKNFYLQTALPKDNELKKNYIGNNIKTIEFEQLNNGIQKVITGMVQSGDYTYSSKESLAIGNNINNYSRNDNKIVLSGIYVNELGNEIRIRKEVPVTMDWYGTTNARITDNYTIYEDIERRIDRENGTIKLSFTVNTEETKKQLLLSKNYVEATIPELNGYKPYSVTVDNSNNNYEFNPETSKLTIEKKAIVDKLGNVTSSIAKANTYIISVKYPLEAYENFDYNTIELKVPVEEYYEGFNNPNTIFDNPYKSNVEKTVFKAIYREEEDTVDRDSVWIRLGDLIPYHSDYIISKAKPMRIYNGISTEENEDTYIVRWNYSTGNSDLNGKITLKETPEGEEQKSDQFLKENSASISMSNLTKNKGIFFNDLLGVMLDDGEIKVYDEETNNLLVSFTKNGENGTEKWGTFVEKNPYYYVTPVEHIRVEIIGMKTDRFISVNNIKELDDEYITNNFTLKEFLDFQKINSNLVAYRGEMQIKAVSNQALYKLPIAIANLSVSKNIISTQITENNEIIKITTPWNSNENQNGWKNGIFLLKFPSELLDVEINSVNVNKNDIEIISYEHFKNEYGQFIKIYTKNENPQSYTITIDCNLIPDSRVSTITKEIELYATNEEVGDYYKKGNDIYDINGNLNTYEIIYKDSTKIQLIAPNSLITNQIASEFDDDGTVIISPNVAELEPTFEENTGKKKNVKIGVQMKNNYVDAISDVVILGKIPFEGNSYVISGKDLKSEYSTVMKDDGIEIPEELQNRVIVYYSENENPTKDLEDISNGWMLKENVKDFSKIKTYIIDFKDLVVEKGTEYIFYYTVEVPFGVELNKTAYSHHGIYFCLNTENGKYRSQIEPNKIGIRAVNKYNLLLTKYQMNTEKIIPGATYKISKLQDDESIEESKTATTNANGFFEMENLYAEVQYLIEEIKSPDNYELNNDVIKIIAHVNNETGELIVEKLSGDIRDNIHVIKNEGEDYKVTINVEDEAKAKLHLTKYESGTNNRIRGTKFRIIGEGLPESGRIVTTNVNGELIFDGIKIGKEYSLIEIKADGYYLTDTIRFKLNNENGLYGIEILDGTVRNSTIHISEEIVIADIEVENEKIPTFDLIINKVAKGSITDENSIGIPIEGAIFKLYKESKEIGTYTTDSQGKLYINGLYQYDSSKDIDQTYVLKEVYAPEGYVKTDDLTFIVSNVFGIINYQEIIDGGNDARDFESDGNTVTVTIEDSPSFKLIKKDEESGERIPNTKFAFYNVENGQSVARNSKGEIIGNKEEINGEEYYTLTTDENGEIIADFQEGLYKAVEVEADEKYDISNSTEYFGIGKTKEAQNGLRTEWIDSIGGENDDVINSIALTEDGGYVSVGYFMSNNITIGDKVIINHNTDNTTDGMIIKYNSDGEVEWVDSVGGSSDDLFTSVIGVEDGGCIVVGNFNSKTMTIGNQVIENYNQLSNSDTADGVIIKYDNNGVVEWVKTVKGEKEENLKSIAKIQNGGYYIAGTFSSVNLSIDEKTIRRTGYRDNVAVIKFDVLNEVEWIENEDFDSSFSNSVESVKSTKDGGCIVAGEYQIYNNKYGFVGKYSSNGELEWMRKQGSISFYSAIESENGDVIVVGTFSRGISIGDTTLWANGTTNGLILKYKENGDIEWFQQISGNNYNYINSIIEAKEGGYVLVGEYYDSITSGKNKLTSVGNSDGMIIKIAKDGKTEWMHSYGGGFSDTLNAIIEAENGQYIVAGNFQSAYVSVGDKMKKNYSDSVTNVQTKKDGIIIKYNTVEVPELILKNTEKIGGMEYENITSIIPTIDGGYTAVGSFESQNLVIGDKTIINKSKPYDDIYRPRDGIIIKYNEYGEIEWVNSIGGSEDESISSVAETEDGGYVVTGTFDSESIDLGQGIILEQNNYNRYPKEGFVIKYNSEGEVEWARTISGDNSVDINSVDATIEGGCIVVGNFNSDSIVIGNEIVINNTINNSNNNYVDYKTDGIIIKYNSEGEVEWVKSIGGDDSESVDLVYVTKDGGFLVAGHFNGDSIKIDGNTIYNNGSIDGLIIKYNKDGDYEWSKCIGGSSNDSIDSITETKNGEYIIVGSFYSEYLEIDNNIITNHNAESSDGLIIKLNQNGIIENCTCVGGNDSEYINTVAATEDGGFIVGGRYSGHDQYVGIGNKILNNESDYYYNSDGMIIKYNNELEVEWAEGLHGYKSDGIGNIIQKKDGNYIASGTFSSTKTTFGDKTIENTNIYGSYNGTTDVVLFDFYLGNGVLEQEEITVNNTRKQFKIRTNISKIDGIKGGRISGEGNSYYEVVKYGDKNINPIVITPDENYEIIRITVNGKEWQFEKELDGSYTMPQFDSVVENKNIVATFALKNNKITINKKDSVSGEKLSGARFKLDQIEERSEPINDDIIGELKDNSDLFQVIDYDNEVSDCLGDLTNNGTYFFVEQDGKYVPNNSRTYQLENGGTNGIAGTATSYIPIDLSGLDGTYRVVVNSNVSSRSGYDYGFATINQSTSVPSFNNDENSFICISGTSEQVTIPQDYESTNILQGGQIYYLHLGYKKASTSYVGTDQFVVNSVKVYKTKNATYNFIKTNDDEYISTNEGINNTVCNSYIPIDLSAYEGLYSLIINASVSSQSYDDFGYIAITKDENRPSYNSTENLKKISGTESITDFETILEGGDKYYLHIGYYKNANISYGEDKFTINNIYLRLNYSNLYHTEVETNMNGQAITQIPYGKYTVKEIKAPKGYLLDETPTVIEFRSYDGAPHEFNIDNDKICSVIVHHYLKEDDGTLTTIKVSEDEIIQGKQGEKYNTSFKVDLLNYEPEKNTTTDEYILPENLSGEFSYEDKEIIFYYTQRNTLLTVHHYIEGTETEVPLANGDIAETDYIMGKKGETYTTTPISNELLNEEYDFYEVQGEPTGTYEDNEIIVTYYYKHTVGTLKINKSDTDTKEAIEGVKFGVYRKDYEKIELNEAEKIGYWWDKVYADQSNEAEVDIAIEAKEPEIIDAFGEIDGKYIPTICAWYKKNKGYYGYNDYASSYVNIDLRDKPETYYYILSTNIEMRNTTNHDSLKIGFPDNYAYGNYDIQLEGENNENYEIILKGGRYYLLELYYNKKSSEDIEDYVAIEMKLYNTENNRTERVNIIPYEMIGKATDEEIIIEKIHYTEYGLPFVEYEGNYIATTCQKYMNDNGINFEDYGISDSGELIEIDLSDKEGYYIVSMDLLMQNTGEYDEFFAVIDTFIDSPEDTYEYKYLTEEYGEITNSLRGEHNEKYQATLEGGKKYALHIAYNKYSTSDYEDYVAVNNLKVYKANLEKRYMGFDKTEDGKYISNNQMKDRTIANSVIPIDLTNYKDNLKLTVNAEISSEEYGDYGKIIITDTIDVGNPKNYIYTLVNISGTKDAQNYTMELEKGKQYYLHMIYEKNDYNYNPGKDTFTINSIKLEEIPYTIVTTNSQGIAEITLPTNEYTLVEVSPKDGYEPIEPQKITLTQSGLDLTIENEKIKGKVIVNHFVEGTEENITDYDGIEVQPELKKDLYGEEFTTTPRTDLYDKYELVGAPQETTGIYSETPQTITYYYRIKQYPYTVNYLLKDNDDDDTNNQVLHEAKISNQSYDYGTLIDTTNERVDIEGYFVDSINVDKLKITANNNIINIYYSIDPAQTKPLSYTVEYYKDDNIVSDDTAQINQNVQVLQPDTLEVDKTLIDSNKYDGYKLDHTDPANIPDEINNGDVIKVYYTKRNDLQYTIHYKEQGTNETVAEDKVVRNQTFGDLISESAIDIIGYDKIDPTATEIEVTTGLNEFTFYYKRAKFNYKVEYYYDDVKDDTKTETIEATYKDVISTYEEKNKVGYAFYKVENMPLTISANEDDNIIKVYYLTDNGQTKTLEYTIEYYKDGVLQSDDTQHETKEVHILSEDTMVVDKTKINTTDKYEDYIFVNTDPQEIPTQITSGGIIKVYYVRAKYSYKIEYYYDNQIDESRTESGEAYKGDIIEEYANKSKDGCEFDRVEGLPLTISSNLDRNRIKVYYSSIRTITIKHIDKTTGEVLKTEVRTGKDDQTVTTTEESIDGYICVEKPEVEKYKFDSSNLTVSYYYAKERELVIKYYDKNTNKEIIEEVIKVGPDGDPYNIEDTKKEIPNYTLVEEPDNPTGTFQENNETRKYYYAKNTQVVVKYVDKDTGEELTTSQTIEGYVGKGYTTEKEDIAGYYYVSSTDNISGKMTEDTIEIIYYYTKPVEKAYTSYTIKYVDIDTGKSIKTPKVVTDQEIGTTIYAKALIIDIDNYTYEDSDKDIIILKDGVDNTITLYYKKNVEKEEPQVEPKEELKQESKVEPKTETTPKKESTLKVVPQTNEVDKVAVKNTHKSNLVTTILGISFIFIGCVLVLVFNLKHKEEKEAK